MLEVTIPAIEIFNEETMRFEDTIAGQKLLLEHSLVSLSKWEETWEVPFLSTENKTTEQTLDYIRCMTITKNVSPKTYSSMPQKIISEIGAYIERPMTATTFHNERNRPSRDKVTAELIYYWMFSLQIPKECEKWHLNKLLTVIKVCNLKNSPPRKYSKRDWANKQRELNAQRRAQYGSKG